MDRYRLAVLIILGLAALALFWSNIFPELVIRDYYILCPDGVIVGCYPYFCSNREILQCEDRVCKPPQDDRITRSFWPCAPLNYYQHLSQ